MPRAELTLIGKPGCHLCDDAREVIKAVVADVESRADAPEIVVSELSILDDQELYDEHVEDIPVITINGKVHTFWRVDPARLTTALLGVS
ncbi:MAG: thioredoxin family protein [Subtercola sp.]|nr:thioredoxin family protein [Subtercola sp.]